MFGGPVWCSRHLAEPAPKMLCCTGCLCGLHENAELKSKTPLVTTTTRTHCPPDATQSNLAPLAGTGTIRYDRRMMAGI